MIFRLNINWHNLFWYFQSKIPLPISKGNPDSDDESIMRKVRSLDVDVNDEIGLNVLKIYITFDRFLIDLYYTKRGEIPTTRQKVLDLASHP